MTKSSRRLRTIRERTEAAFWKERFHPGLLGMFTNPLFILRRGIRREIARAAGMAGGRLLDFGCGRKPYRSLFAVDSYVGLDVRNRGHDHRREEIDVYYDGWEVPFADCSFDTVIATEVLEHIPEPQRALREIYRVLRPNGVLIVTVPFVWDEHEVPFDFFRYSQFGIRHLLEASMFTVVSLRKTTTYVETLFQMWNQYLYRTLSSAHPLARQLFVPFVIAPFTLLGLLLAAILPKSDAWYNNSVVVARRVSGQ